VIKAVRRAGLRVNAPLYTSLIGAHRRATQHLDSAAAAAEVPERAAKLMGRLRREGIVEDAPLHTSVICWFLGAGLPSEAWEAYHDSRKAGVEPDAVTFTAMMVACAQGDQLEQARRVEHIVGAPEQAMGYQLLFDRLRRDQPDRHEAQGVEHAQVSEDLEAGAVGELEGEQHEVGQGEPDHLEDALDPAHGGDDVSFALESSHETLAELSDAHAHEHAWDPVGERRQRERLHRISQRPLRAEP
jgi:pentatricopeptide repeat protein